MCGAAVAGRDSRDQSQAEAVAWKTAGIACSAELVPDGVHVFGRYSDAGVGDFDGDGAVTFRTSNFDDRFGARILRGVGHEVVDG